MRADQVMSQRDVTSLAEQEEGPAASCRPRSSVGAHAAMVRRCALVSGMGGNPLEAVETSASRRGVPNVIYASVLGSRLSTTPSMASRGPGPLRGDRAGAVCAMGA